MMLMTDIAGLGGVALAGALVLTSLARQRSPWFFVGMLILLLLPLGDLPLAGYVRGGIGDLSMTTLFLLASRGAHRFGWLKTDPTDSPAIWALLVVTACLLYPLALGAAPLDPYRWGFGDPTFLVVLLALALACCLYHQTTVAVAISLAVLAWAAGWYESTNLWDYLIDPLVAIYALGRIFKILIAILDRRTT